MTRRRLHRATAAWISVTVSSCTVGASEQGSSSAPNLTATPTATSAATSAATPTVTDLSAPTTTIEPFFCWHPDDRDRRLFADLDGDSLDEVVFVNNELDGTEVELCESSTLTLATEVVGSANKPAEVHVVDIEGDGTDELLVGGPSGATPFSGGIYRVVDGGWRPDAMTVRVESALDDPGKGGESFTCLDSDGDGLNELLPVTYRIDNDRFTWQAGNTSGEFELPDMATDAWLTASGTCGNVVTHPRGPNVVTEMLSVVDTDAVPGRVADDDTKIGLGVHDEISTRRSAAELLDEAGWVIDVDHYAESTGPFSALDALHRARRVQVLTGPQNHCAGPPLATPDGISRNVALSIQPTGPSSCIDWFNVTIYLEHDFTVEAITLALFGP